MPHAKKHPLNSVNDHSAGTNNNVIGTVTGAISEIPFSVAVLANSLTRRDGAGDSIVPLLPSSANAAASKQYVDNAVIGLKWLAPASVLRIVDDSNMGGVPAVAGSIGEAFVVNNWGGGYNDGDIVEWNGTAFVVIVSNAGGFVPSGTRVVVIEPPLATGSFSTHDNEIAVADGAGGWTFITPVDGNALLIVGESSIYENSAYTYDATPGAWIKFASFTSSTVMPDVNLAGTSPVNADVTTWSNGDRGFGIGTDASIWWMRKQGGNVYSVQMT